MPKSVVRYSLTLSAIVASLAGLAAWSQEPSGVAEPAETAVEENAENPGAADPGTAEPGDDDSGPAVGLDEIPELDQQTYERDDDDFIPTEEIPVDQSIPFPTDI